ncbi:TetR/AcrR family transcriptional regulator [Pseudaminobacter sp. 19-2017]|uniref:TetR/AcrR family transcriptional regulator n=1 Tax=Pseudaminobacter soli (ex Zhang et al. 2022) TaxID=2831468 RepID=A0A942I2K6_9HYPH|nr:TetR/AcrR family transcriptional regulator [Pseudaminobacter soli]MBS3649832.1 TetR/AcrR family transcriptional regulator [Pseudaminobacter soli]
MVQVKKAEVRDAILEAAARLFEEKGYVGTSISEIGQTAGVASSGIYIYFGSKLDLFYTIFSPWLMERLDRLDRELKAVDGHRNKVRRIVDTLWVEIPNESNFFANNLMQAVSTVTKADHYNGDLLEWCEQRVAGMLREAAPRASRRVDYVSLAHILFMSFNGFVAGAYLGVRGDKADPAIEAMTDLIVAASAPTLVPLRS